MSSKTIDISQYVKVSTFADKVGVNASLIRYYAKSDGLKSIMIDGCLFIDLDNLKTWPPKPKKHGNRLWKQQSK